jgi:outer membrane protein assembly factor BamD (BamD/ComL family)
MGRKSNGRGQYLCICVALLSALTGCSVARNWQERQDIRDTLRHGQSLLNRAHYDASINEYQKVVMLAHEGSPSDAALFNIGVIYAHPLNPGRDPQKALDYFNRVVAGYPGSAWRQHAQAWIGVLEDAKKSQQEVADAKSLIERSQQDLENSKQELEKSYQAIEKSKAEMEKARLEIDKFKQVIEKSRQVDIEIEQKKRDRGR